MSVVVSVVIACNDADTVIVECLERILGQGKSPDLEVILAMGSENGLAAGVEKQFPWVKLLRLERPTTLPVLRGRAIAMANGDIIAILDPYSMVSQDWKEQVIAAHSVWPNAVIGGAVDLYQAEHQGLLAWAQYFNEYGMFMSPVEEGAMDILPGCNLSYKRKRLFKDDKPVFDEFWKTFVHEDLEASGDELWQAPAVRVELYKPVGFFRFLASRFTHGRCYAAMRCTGAPLFSRVLRGLTAPLLPFVLQYRWGKRIWPKRHHRGKFILTLPIQFALFACWSLGELVGYLAGGGDSCRKLYF